MTLKIIGTLIIACFLGLVVDITLFELGNKCPMGHALVLGQFLVYYMIKDGRK